MTKTFKFSLLLSVSFFIILYSCNKNNEKSTTDNETQTASDYSFAQTTNDDVSSISSQSEDNRLTGSLGGSIPDSTYGLLLGSCATISVDTISVPHQLTIDFGSSNCLCFDGRYRRGKILVSFTGRYRDSASSHTITFDNYYVNNYKVEGSQTVINKGRNMAGNTTFLIQVNSTITDTAGNKLTYTSVRTREWIAGESTSGLHGWSDDVYSITGTASGTTFAGASFTANITSPLLVALNCKWVEAGTIAFTPSGKLTRTIDFGSGTCDNNATVSVAGISFAITLR